MQAYEAYSNPEENKIKSEIMTRDEFAKTFARSSYRGSSASPRLLSNLSLKEEGE